MAFLVITRTDAMVRVPPPSTPRPRPAGFPFRLGHPSVARGVRAATPTIAPTPPAPPAAPVHRVLFRLERQTFASAADANAWIAAQTAAAEAGQAATPPKPSSVTYHVIEIPDPPQPST
jgi:hypothetical protein